MFTFSNAQLACIRASLSEHIFLYGPAGSGKTTVGVERLLYLMSQGVRADSILLIVPQRTLASPYYEALSYPGVVAGGVVSVLTVGGLAQRMVELFWPLVAEQAGFAFPDQPPVFLTLETAQYYMARLVWPLLVEQGYFEAVTISHNRLYSQILDNLNKAALVGFPHTEISQRLKEAWVGKAEERAKQMRVYDDAQDCANRFREYCLAHNLLDFSLQLEVFRRHLWGHPLCRQYLTETYRHLIVDNLEEDTPLAHDLLDEWLPDFDSALLIYDSEGGYRRFLGADPQSGWSLRERCSQQVEFAHSFVAAPALEALGAHLGAALRRPIAPPPLPPLPLSFAYHRYYPEMLDWVADRVRQLVFEEQVPPAEIVVLSPFMPDSLRFSLTDRLQRLGIPSRSHRPSRTLREEPAAQCLLTLTALAHPQWGLYPTKFDVAYALTQAIEGMDLVRAQLLSEIVYRVREGIPTLGSFERIKPEMQERITYGLGNRYETLRSWLEEYTSHPIEELDIFLSRLFGELLSQPGFGFHQNLTAGEVAANLVESAQKFRWAVAPTPFGEGEKGEGKPLGQEYLKMVQDGVVAAQYLQSWQVQPDDAVLLAPAYTFLMRNHAVDYQFWLDIASRSWFERLYQPLTQPYVLSRQWPPHTAWSDAEEYEANLETLYRLTLGLLRRCRRHLFLGLSELNEQGDDQKGPLLKAMQRVLKQNNPASALDQ